VGASLASRSILAAAFLFVSLVCWEGTVAWGRYEPVSGHLGGFLPTPLGVQVREPGFSLEDPLRTGTGALVPEEAFFGARYDTLTPVLLAPLLGSEPRIRLTHILAPPTEAERPPVAWPWGGGRDPLGRFFWITRPLTGWLLDARAVDVYPEDLEYPVLDSLHLELRDEALVLAAGEPD